MKYAICNETFQDWDHLRVCRFVAETGYTGLELAPFTLAPRITDVNDARRRELRQQAEDQGLTIMGLHWLLAKTEGFQITSPEDATRARTADYLRELTRCCRQLGGDILVFGSPMQRRIPAGATRAQATDYAVDTFGRILDTLKECNVRLCVEPLSTKEADFINTADEGMEIVRRLNHPNVCLHLDVKAMSSESIAIPELIRRHAGHTGHFHANDANMRGPGFGEIDFKPIFQALHDNRYNGWVSVEVFDYTPDPETIARDSLRYMKECEATIRLT